MKIRITCSHLSCLDIHVNLLVTWSPRIEGRTFGLFWSMTSHFSRYLVIENWKNFKFHNFNNFGSRTSLGVYLYFGECVLSEETSILLITLVDPPVVAQSRGKIQLK